MSKIFGPIRQVGYVTEHVWQKLDFLSTHAGIGPWFVKEGIIATGCVYKGTPIELEITVAFANSGDLQLEVIQPTSPGPSMFAEWLRQDGRHDEIHHYSSWPQDYDATYERARAAGYRVIQEASSKNGRYAFFEHPANLKFIFEIAEFLPERRRLYDAIRDAAADWDGQDAIRRYWP